MCRLCVYVGPPVLVAEVCLYPSRAIIKQSFDARERRNDASLPHHLGLGNLNGDGFGIGWFSGRGGAAGGGVGGSSAAAAAAAAEGPSPCVFTSVTPAWNNDNLNRLATKIESGLVFAHVRAAYPGMPVSEQNCHPFQWGRYLFMHNGVVGGFLRLRRRLIDTLRDEAYDAVQSFHSDSAVSFAVFLNQLPDARSPQSPGALLAAMRGTIAAIAAVQAEAGEAEVSLLNFVVSDGATVVATRYVSHAGEEPASLYYAEGAAFERVAGAAGGGGGAGGGAAGAAGARSGAVTGEGDYRVAYTAAGAGSRVCLIASEPVTSSADDWVEVPRNTALVVARGKGGALSVLRAPLDAPGGDAAAVAAAQAEAAHCLEAVARPPPAPCPAPRQPSASPPKRPPPPPGLRPAAGSQASLARLPSASMSAGDSGAAAADAPAEAAEHTLTGHEGAVVALAAAGDLLFSGSTDCTIRAWSLGDCRLLRTLRGHRYPIRALALAGAPAAPGAPPPWLLSAGAKTVHVWSTADFSCRAVVVAGDGRGSLKALAAGADGRTLYVGGQDCAVRAYGLPPPPSPAAAAAAASPAGTPLAAGAAPAAESPPRPPPGARADAPAAESDAAHAHCGAVTCLAAAACGRLVASGSDDSTVRVWRAADLGFVGVLRGHRGAVLSLAAAPGAALLSGGRDGLIRVWDADTLVCRRTLSAHGGDVLGLAASRFVGRPVPERDPLADLASPVSGLVAPDSRPASPAPAVQLFATAAADGGVRLWASDSLACVRALPARGRAGAPPPPALAVALTADGVAAAMADGTIRLIECGEPAAAAGGGAELDSAAAAGGGAAAAAAAAAAGVAPPRLGAADAAPLARLAKRPRLATAAAAAAPPAAPLEREFERALRAFIRIPTVSADPARREASFAGAKFLLRLLEGMGAEARLARPLDDKNPLVLGRVGADPAKPTVTFYGHYDVQPAAEPEWATDPFELAAADGYYYGRGASDNKGPLLAFVFAVRELLDECGGVLPVNVAFLFEGEEENGSAGFREAVRADLRWFAGTRLVVISNTLWVGERLPCLTYGMRGMISMSLEVAGPARDLHSGNEGGAFAEPLADLARLLGSLSDGAGRVRVPGFYDGVRDTGAALGPALDRLAASGEFSVEGYRAAIGVPRLCACGSERELLAARWAAPSLSVVDVRVGGAEDAELDGDGGGDGAPGGGGAAARAPSDAHYRFGPTRFSVIPRAAVGKLSVRFVPDQDAAALVAAVRAHVAAAHAAVNAGSGNVATLRVHARGDWWEADPGGAPLALAERAVAAEWGAAPLLVREGGTMPVARALEELLGAPALLLPMGQSSDACHLANERIRRLNLMRGKNVVKRLLLGLGTEHAAQQAGGGTAAPPGH